MADMKLLIGLGNPGSQHAGHRHNVGFMALDEIARRHNFAAWRKRFHGLVAEGAVDGVKVLLIKPQTYMNESGRSVGEAMRFFKLGPDDVYVFHDELDLAPGKLKVKTGGGAAGHNGLRSITQQIGADFHRVRIGIGHPGHKDRVHSYVLHDFAKADQVWLETLLDEMARAAGFLAGGDAPRFMTEVARNRTDQKTTEPPKTEKKTAEAKPAAVQERKLAKWDFVEKAKRGEGAFAEKLKSLLKPSGNNNGDS
ncbi:MAG: aminoacyl-tRNA hydrolase [Hyphomicrobiaceae bacterium]